MADEKAIDWGKFEVEAPPGSSARETVVVHCANGHRLVVPASHAGKMGKCAKCQAAFRIPSAAEAKGTVGAPSAPQQSDASTPSSTAEPPSAKPTEPGPSMSGSGAAASEAAPPPDDSSEPTTPATPATAEPPPPSSRDRPGPTPASVADLVTRLWEEVERGGVIELHIDGGAVILPKWFERGWSEGTHALFASHAADGSITLTAVAWESIRRIVVRNVADLPEGMFD